MEELYKKYNYPSANYFYQILKENGIKATHKQVKDFIDKQSIQQITTKKRKIKEKLKYITASAPYEIFQIDLIDYQKYSKTNKGYKYVLIAVDVFTRKAYAIPIKTKQPNDVLEGFIEIIEEEQPLVITHDDGNEWKGVFKNFIEKHDIIEITTETGNHNALGIIDRFTRTIKEMIYKYMVANDTTTYILVLDKLIELYNNKPHTAIDNIKPNEADKNDNMLVISHINYNKKLFNQGNMKKQNKKISIGDSVRVIKEKKTFTKGYETGYSNKVYRVMDINLNYALLDDGKKYKLDKLMKVEGGDNLNTYSINTANKRAKVKRKLNREGLNEDNIIERRRR